MRRSEEGKGKKILVRFVFGQSSRKSDQFLAGYLAGLPWNFEKNYFTVALNLDKNPAGNPARFRPDCDVSQSVINFVRLFPSFLSNFCPKYLPFLHLACPCIIERKALNFPSFNLCQNLEISSMVLETTPYMGSLWKFEEVDGVVLEGEALRCYLS